MREGELEQCTALHPIPAMSSGALRVVGLNRGDMAECVGVAKWNGRLGLREAGTEARRRMGMIVRGKRGI